MRRVALTVCLAGVAALGLASPARPAHADPPSPGAPVGPRHGAILGIVPARNAAGFFRFRSNNLINHGGPVMTTNTVYAIYWVPSGYSASPNAVSPNYRSLIDGYFANVAADDGKTSNVYYASTQYSGIQYHSAFGGSVVDTAAFPANGCTDSATAVCLSDAQLQAEIDRVAAAQSWPRGLGAEYFLFTPRGVGSCYAAGSCAFTQYCAYHSDFAASAGTTLYANMPYADTVPSACDAGQHPNNDDADATLNVTSHEHNETITDALGTAWYDSQGYEDGDKCAWNFGAQRGGSAGAEYNQIINNAHYELQQEWSNASSGCVLTGK